MVPSRYRGMVNRVASRTWDVVNRVRARGGWAIWSQWDLGVGS